MLYNIHGVNAVIFKSTLVTFMEFFALKISDSSIVIPNTNPKFIRGYESCLQFLKSKGVAHDFIASFEICPNFESFFIGLEDGKLSFGLSKYDYSGEPIIRQKEPNSKNHIRRTGILAVGILQNLKFDTNSEICIYAENMEEDIVKLFSGTCAELEKLGLLAILHSIE